MGREGRAGIRCLNSWVFSFYLVQGIYLSMQNMSVNISIIKLLFNYSFLCVLLHNLHVVNFFICLRCLGQFIKDFFYYLLLLFTTYFFFLWTGRHSLRCRTWHLQISCLTCCLENLTWLNIVNLSCWAKVTGTGIRFVLTFSLLPKIRNLARRQVVKTLSSNRAVSESVFLLWKSLS